MTSRTTIFFGGSTGPWRVQQQQTITGESICSVARLSVVSGSDVDIPENPAWMLTGVTSNMRYTSGEEASHLQKRQPGLGRQEATMAALIPIRKTAEWWALPQDQRREIVEARSLHISKGMAYLPAIARKLHHCRDLGADEPFDFLTWFEFAPKDIDAFEDLLQFLRASEEWRYVDREVDIRLARE